MSFRIDDILKSNHKEKGKGCFANNCNLVHKDNDSILQQTLLSRNSCYYKTCNYSAKLYDSYNAFDRINYVQYAYNEPYFLKGKKLFLITLYFII